MHWEIQRTPLTPVISHGSLRFARRLSLKYGVFFDESTAE